MGVALYTDLGRSVDVDVQDYTGELLDLIAGIEQQEITLTSDTEVDDIIINVANTASLSAGSYLFLNEDGRTYESRILSTTATTITLNDPLDYAYTTAAVGYGALQNLNVNGSVTAQTAFIRPAAGVKWHITRMLVEIVDNADMNDTLFGGIPALTNGVLFRISNGVTKNLFSVRDNGDFALRSFDANYSEAGNPGLGLTAFRVRKTFTRSGAVIELDGKEGGETADQLEVIIRDDLTALSRFNVIFQGHVVTE